MYISGASKCSGLGVPGFEIQRYLAHKKHPPPRTLQ